MKTNSILAFICENPFLLPLPLVVKIMLIALDIGVLIWLIEKFKDKKNILLEITYVILALLILLLLLNSAIQIVDFIEFCRNFFKDMDALLSANIPILYVSNAQNFIIFITILVFVAFCALILFFLTRFILGRKVKLTNSFWEHKDIAMSKITWCNLLFFAMLFLIFLTAFSCFGLIFTILDNFDVFNSNTPAPHSGYVSPGYHFPYSEFLFPVETTHHFQSKAMGFILSAGLAFILVVVIFCAFIFQTFSLSRGSIDKLARTLNATEIIQSTQLRPKEQTLLNLITEMAIASSCPLPRVFILKNEKGINAMCSGEHFGKKNEKIAIFVTQGALNSLSRDELQAVIGHEFSHAFHHDVALNLRIFSLVFALSCVMIVGRILLEGATRSASRKTSNSKNDSKGFVGIVAIALVFFALGYVGMLFAQIIQAAISRQKEFLADASSVQYTRNPQGLKSALQKIARTSSAYQAKENAPKKLTYLTSPKAYSYAHMFFLPCCSMIFDTHPPLEQRIAHLEQMGAKI
ncbi:M48 family metalloprotease [Campylobacter sp. MIT 21-1685]|uniref:M48 family metalloprotease n=1 Tax=unclassified Campylobacter TaxID=2593542 RepID=UPI00224A7B03|nr:MULTISPECIES: M48 family metalloprotease [unclassified Campylobacter]MCX2683382.1 M48 family metalloprotease [Campylobacter sp. MIT 21-1684]MCX2751691.1 M48 family metalloprotease [Campylobacter sp. MIT 21-1682]MCX2807893.1 M48 family metalloprotease [Campylobacter sp. MIT 21-1685]